MGRWKRMQIGDINMALTWDLVVKVEPDVFEKFKEEFGIEVPDDLQELVLEANAGTPSDYRIKDETGKERLFGTLLSYTETVRDNVFKVMRRQESRKLLPIGVDPFGNYFYENVLLGEIVFIDHETDNIYKISDTLDEMLRSLY